MTSFEEGTQSFIVRIWREPSDAAGAELEWKGLIRHVPSGEQSYFRELDDIDRFILPYMTAIGIKAKRQRRFLSWLRQARSHQ